MELAIARESQIFRSIDLSYRRTDDISFAKELASNTKNRCLILARLSKKSTRLQITAVGIEDAIQLNASDIH